MNAFDPAAYPPAIADLLREPRLAPLGPGRPDSSVRRRLEALADDRAWLPQVIQDRDMAAACRAGLWLHHDFLDEAHTISQDLHTVEGSYWHALMHRREPDPDNAAYWLKRVGTHAIHADLARAAAELGYVGKGPGWDAFAFNDACAAHRGKGDTTEELLRRVQRAEWELLFAYCFGRAVGS
jgi:hypothetical protein